MENQTRMMKNYRSFLLLTVLYSGLVGIKAVSLQDLEPAVTFLPSVRSTSSLSSASTSIPPSIGTQPSTIHSTSPTTTSEFTTETTTTTSVSSTTEASTTITVSSTTETSTTTPKPSPPIPNPGIWVVSDGNTTCILAKLTASFVVPYVTSDGKNLNSSLFSLPVNATANGSCQGDGNTQKLALSWSADQGVNYNSLAIIFKRKASNGSEEKFFVSEITLGVYPDTKNFPNSTSNYLSGQLKGTDFYQTKVNTSYRCSSESQIHFPMNGSSSNSTALITVKHFQLEAFRTQHGEQFSTAMDCPADGMLTSDVVPIAVGCALAALVVVVLIAYLIGRRRARQRGYQSV